MKQNRQVRDRWVVLLVSGPILSRIEQNGLLKQLLQRRVKRSAPYRIEFILKILNYIRISPDSCNQFLSRVSKTDLDFKLKVMVMLKFAQSSQSYACLLLARNLIRYIFAVWSHYFKKKTVIPRENIYKLEALICLLQIHPAFATHQHHFDHITIDLTHCNPI